MLDEDISFDGAPRPVDAIEQDLTINENTRAFASPYAHGNTTRFEVGEVIAPDPIEFESTTVVHILTAEQRHLVMLAVAAQVDDDLGFITIGSSDDRPIIRPLLTSRDGDDHLDLCKVLVASTTRFKDWIADQHARDWADIRWRLPIEFRVPALGMLRRLAHQWHIYQPSLHELERPLVIQEVFP